MVAELQAASCKLQAASCKLQAASCKPGYRGGRAVPVNRQLQVESFKLKRGEGLADRTAVPAFATFNFQLAAPPAARPFLQHGLLAA
jgi:hypothetical protein